MRSRILLLSFLILAGCLRTREDLKEAETASAMKEQVLTLQKSNADSASRMDELMEQNRQLTGRLEELDHRVKKYEEQQGTESATQQKTVEESKRTNELLQETVTKLENQVQALQEELVTLKTKDLGKSSGKTEESKDKEKGRKEKELDKGVFESAINAFQDKKWKEAILSFDQYREKNPKGKFAAEATYKTGVCFQELGMLDEAKVFYQDVVAKFPKSDMAKKAQYRLKAMK